MNDDLDLVVSPFAQICHTDELGGYWTARELMEKLEYATWQDFHNAIKRAMKDCEQAGRDISENFREIPKVSGARGPAQKDYRLTRYACHLIVMTARTDSAVSALARTYFSDKVTEAEQADFEEWRRRAIQSYVAHGYSATWARRRVDGVVIRNKLTHEWSVRGIEDREFPVLTDAMHMDMFGLSIEHHKGVKNFPVTYRGKRARYKGELRPSLTDVELAIVGLGESVARELHIARNSQGFSEIQQDVHEAGQIAGETRQRIEQATGRAVVSPRNMVTDPDGGLWTALPSGDESDKS